MMHNQWQASIVSLIIALTVHAAPGIADDEGDDITWVKVPPNLQGRGYHLQTDSGTIELNQAKVQSYDPHFMQTLYLRNSEHRIIDVEKMYFSGNALSRFDPDLFRIGLHSGATHVHGDAFKGIFLDGLMNHSTLDLIYQPSIFGLYLAGTAIDDSEELSFGNSKVKVTYRDSQLKAGITLDTAPFHTKRGFLGRTHAMFYMGAMSSSMTIEITDNVVTITDEDQSSGGFSGLELRWPIMQFWLGARLEYSYHLIEFKEFELKTNSMQRHLSLGGSYAF